MSDEKKRGRPSTYSQIVADYICEQIALGRSVANITQESDMPHESTVYNWLRDNPFFVEQYTRAREQQADHYADEIIALADTPVEARKVTIKADGSEEITIGDSVERTRIQIDARKWYAGKLRPKKYGDTTRLVGDPEQPIQLISSVPRPPK